MFKKLLFAFCIFTLYINANTLNTNDNIDCKKQFEFCMKKCDKQNSDDLDPMCIEKCEMLYDKCLLTQETNAQINLRYLTDEEKELIQYEIDSNSKLENNIKKIQSAINKQ